MDVIKMYFLKDGEADAISVDSGNVFKASLHPYNLKPIMAETHGPQKDTCYYAVALVRKSSTFKFSELKNKRSCHTGIGHMAGWYAPLSVLQEKKLLNWTEDEVQRAASRFFSASCVPGAQELNLCKLCAGQGGKKCKLSNDEPFYNCHGAFKCLKDNKGDVAFVTHMTVPGTYYAVAVVKKNNKDITWNNLKGKKSCHTAVGRTAGWNIPVGLINKKNNNCDIGSYFSQSCAPGSDSNSNLCQLCIGDPQKPLANTKCSPSDAEAYYGYSGALRCLVEKGDVAFVKHTTIFENTEGKEPLHKMMYTTVNKKFR
ncbi:serotransferrin-B-like [Pyxicephalus adspersus]|uniref:serotransferrin-B-like n=1 Tax=Pyxicephalus adspersus TaxID=30357 RepID=UPI003B5902B0